MPPEPIPSVHRALVGAVAEFGATTFPPDVSHNTMLFNSSLPAMSDAVSRAFVLAELSEASTTLDKSPIMAMTTKSSMRVNPFGLTFIGSVHW